MYICLWLLLRIFADQSQQRHWPVRGVSASIIIARKRICRKVMFSHVSVCHSVQGGPHTTITYDTLGHRYLPP